MRAPQDGAERSIRSDRRRVFLMESPLSDPGGGDGMAAVAGARSRCMAPGIAMTGSFGGCGRSGEGRGPALPCAARRGAAAR